MSEEFVTKEEFEELKAELVLDSQSVSSITRKIENLEQKIKDLSDWALDIKQAQEKRVDGVVDRLNKLVTEVAELNPAAQEIKRIKYEIVKAAAKDNNEEEVKNLTKLLEHLLSFSSLSKETIVQSVDLNKDKVSAWAVAVVYRDESSQEDPSLEQTFDVIDSRCEEGVTMNVYLHKLELHQTIIAAIDELAAIKIVEDHLLREHGENLHIISRVATRIESV